VSFFPLAHYLLGTDPFLFHRMKTHGNLCTKKSASRALIATYKRNPRNENRFASPNRHRTKKKRLAFSRKRKHGEKRADVAKSCVEGS